MIEGDVRAGVVVPSFDQMVLSGIHEDECNSVIFRSGSVNTKEDEASILVEKQIIIHVASVNVLFV